MFERKGPKPPEPHDILRDSLALQFYGTPHIPPSNKTTVGFEIPRLSEHFYRKDTAGVAQEKQPSKTAHTVEGIAIMNLADQIANRARTAERSTT